jgi:hypothetical protein
MQMDNIGKMVLGLVAFIGLIILLIPQGNPLEEKPATAVVEAPKNLPPADNGDDGVDGEEAKAPGDAGAPPPVTPATANDPALTFGQPMMDPTPPGQRAAQQQQKQEQQQGETPEDDDANTSGPAGYSAPQQPMITN